MIKRLPYILISWPILAALKVSMVLVGLFAVAASVAGDGYKRTPKMWRPWADAQNTPKQYQSRWGVYYFWAIRNPVKWFEVSQPEGYSQFGGIDESKPGLQWRYRYSKYLDSFRVVWGEPRDKGKRELYLGWKIGSHSPCKFTVQVRPF